VRLDEQRCGVGRGRCNQRLKFLAPPTQPGLCILRQRVEVETVQALEKFSRLGVQFSVGGHRDAFSDSRIRRARATKSH
jgi:hypothetical protein